MTLSQLFLEEVCPAKRRLSVAMRCHYVSAASSILAFFKSSVTSADASFSCANSAAADAVPLTDWFLIAGFREES